MATATSNYGWLKPEPADLINVTTQISDTYEDIDTEVKRVENNPILVADDLGADHTITVDEAVVTGLAVNTSSSKVGAEYEVTLSVDFECTVGGTGFSYVYLKLNNVVLKTMLFADQVDRKPGSVTTSGTFAGTGAQNFTVHAEKDVDAGSAFLRAGTCSVLSVKVYDRT